MSRYGHFTDIRGVRAPLRTMQVTQKNGSSGRTRTYNPPVNSCGARLCDAMRQIAITLIFRVSSGHSLAPRLLPFATAFDREGAQKWAHFLVATNPPGVPTPESPSPPHAIVLRAELRPRQGA